MRIGLLEYTETEQPLSTWLTTLLLIVQAATAVAMPRTAPAAVHLAPGSSVAIISQFDKLPPRVQKTVTRQIALWQPHSSVDKTSDNDSWSNLKLFGKAAPLAPSQPTRYQLPAAASQLFIASLKLALLHRLRVDTIPGSGISAATITRAHIADILNGHTATSVLVPVMTTVALSERAQLRANLWAVVSIFTLGSGDEGTRLREQKVYCCGTYAAPRVMFGTAYLKTRTAVLARACWQAALMAVSSLELRHPSPFAKPGVTIAIAPIAAPPTADVLIFANTGRRVVPAGVKGLPVDASPYFDFDLQPFQETNVISTDKFARYMASKKFQLSSLWSGITPDLDRVAQIGRLLHVRLLFLSRIVDLESSSGTDRRGLPADSAYARSVGYLLDASTGQVLWAGAGTAAMRSGVNLIGGHSNLNVIIEDAERFALSALNRKFQSYKHQFVTGHPLQDVSPAIAVDG